MNRISVGLIGLCSLAAGILIGLGIAVFTQPTLRELEGERDKLVAQNSELQKALTEKAESPEPANGKAELAQMSGKPSAMSWGPMLSVPEDFGPGSPFRQFAVTLRERGLWKENGWAIRRIPAGTSDFHLDLWEPGEGKIMIEAILPGIEHGRFDSLYILFQPWELADLKKASIHLHAKVMGLGRAFGLSEEECSRLDLLCRAVPVARPSQFKDAIAVFTRDMPQRVQDRFIRCLEVARKQSLHQDGAESLVYNTPAIGCPLSNRFLVELVFGAADDSAWGLAHYNDVGPCWTLCLVPANRDARTSWKEPTRVGNGPVDLDWPRLTMKEFERVLREWKKQ